MKIIDDIVLEPDKTRVSSHKPKSSVFGPQPYQTYPNRNSYEVNAGDNVLALTSSGDWRAGTVQNTYFIGNTRKYYVRLSFTLEGEAKHIEATRVTKC